MMLSDLLTALEGQGALHASRVKDCRTSCRYLAAALGYDGPEGCPVDVANLDPGPWLTALEAYFDALQTQGKKLSAVTRRNCRSNLRLVLRRAEALGLLAAPLPAQLLARPHRGDFMRQHRAITPYQTTYKTPVGPRRYGLLLAEWPPDIQEGWKSYRAKSGLRVRSSTVRAYLGHMESYLGFITNICGRTPVWADIFDAATVQEFVRWHAGRVGQPEVSVLGRRLTTLCGTMAGVLEHPSRQALVDLGRTLPLPDTVHDKRHHWVSLATLEQVAEGELSAGRAPFLRSKKIRFPGSERASRFAHGTMLKVLIRIPLRGRNLREMKLDRNLYRDEIGHWQIHFRGQELKVGARQGKPNEYQIDLSTYCPELIPVLEEWLQTYRPRLPNAATSPLVFLTRNGRPYTPTELHHELSYLVTMRTGQRFYPHLIRTIWASSYLEATNDVRGAATMLGDTVQMVLKTYDSILNRDQHAKAAAFLSTALRRTG
jgi:hypothetical protein